jgi:hypothetical protein
MQTLIQRYTLEARLPIPAGCSTAKICALSFAEEHMNGTWTTIWTTIVAEFSDLSDVADITKLVLRLSIARDTGL